MTTSSSYEMDTLRKKVDHLSLVIHQPQVFIDEYFSRLRNKIDIFTEQQLSNINPEVPEDTKNEINDRRMLMIDEINKHGKSLQERLVNSSSIIHSGLQSNKFDDLEKKLEQLPTAEQDDFDDLYQKLENEIYGEIKRLEEIVMDNQSFIFIEKLSTRYVLGYLLHVDGYYIQDIDQFEKFIDYSDKRVRQPLRSSLFIHLVTVDLNDDRFGHECLSFNDMDTIFAYTIIH